jgi:hypothetical protein
MTYLRKDKQNVKTFVLHKGIQYKKNSKNCSAVDPDPVPYVFGPLEPGSHHYLCGSGSFHYQANNSKKNLDFYRFMRSLWLFIFEEWCKCTLKSNKNKKTWILFCWHLECPEEKRRIRSRIRIPIVNQWYESADPDPYQNVTDPQHCWKKDKTVSILFYSKPTSNNKANTVESCNTILCRQLSVFNLLKQ